MLRLIFSPNDLAYTRFAFSPLWEVVASVRALKQPGDHALHLPWIKETRPLLEQADLAPLFDLVPGTSRVTPGFLTPAPDSPQPELSEEVAALGDPGLAAAITAYWELALAPHWRRIRALLEGDIVFRARQLAAGGAAALFADLHPGVTWRDDSLYVTTTNKARTVSLDGRGLVLVPSAFIWPRTYSKTYRPWQPVLRYPARGLATLWERGGADAPEHIAAVLGRSRALLLAQLASPASTTDLARRTGLTAGGVSQHLTALRRAGLVTAHRSGRSVLYARTAVADALCGPPMQRRQARSPVRRRPQAQSEPDDGAR